VVYLTVSLDVASPLPQFVTPSFRPCTPSLSTACFTPVIKRGAVDPIPSYLSYRPCMKT